MKTLSLAIVAFCALLVSGCYYDNWENVHPKVAPKPCDTVSVMTFAGNVTSIFNAHSCSTPACHSSAGAAGGVVLDTWSGTHKQVLQGKLMPSIDHSGADGAGGVFWMPLGGARLSPCEVGQINKWVNNGALNN